MPKGPLGGPRPLAVNTFKVAFSILTTEELFDVLNDNEVEEIAKQSMVEAVGKRRFNPDKVVSVKPSYNLYDSTWDLRIEFKDTTLQIHSIKRFVEEYHSSLKDVIEGRVNMKLSETLDDLPPNENTFILIGENRLDEEIFISTRKKYL